MLEVIKAALELVRFTFDTGREPPLTLSGSELPSAAALYRPHHTGGLAVSYPPDRR